MALRRRKREANPVHLQCAAGWCACMKPNLVEATVDEVNRAGKALKASEALLDSELYEDVISCAY